MEKKKDAKKSSTGRVKADNARIDRLKEQHHEHACVDRQRADQVYEGHL